MRHRDDDAHQSELAPVLRGLHFPCSRADLIECALDNQAPPAIVDFLQALPVDRKFRSFAEIESYGRGEHDEFFTAPERPVPTDWETRTAEMAETPPQEEEAQAPEMTPAVAFPGDTGSEAVAEADTDTDTDLPIADYDGRSIHDILARIEDLDDEQIRRLLDHERRHLQRNRLISRYERRLRRAA